MAEITFEDALQKLEEIVEALEKSDLSLDESLARYEEGIKLSKICAKKLEAAKKRVEILIKSDDGSYETKPFEEAIGEAPKREPRKKKAKEEGLF